MADIIKDAPENADLVDIDGHEPETVVICGAEFELKEWPMSTRTLWQEHTKAHDWTDTITAYLELSQKETELFDNPATVQFQRDLVEKLETDQAKNLKKMGKFSDAKREKLFEAAEVLETERQRLRAMTNPIQAQALRESMGLGEELETVKARVRDIRLRFVHKLSGVKTSFAKWAGDPTGDDFINAEAVIKKGLKRWQDQGQSPAPNRAQRRAKAKQKKS